MLEIANCAGGKDRPGKTTLLSFLVDDGGETNTGCCALASD